MSEESKTYVFGNDGCAAMSAALANSNLAPLMAAMNNNGFGGEGAWWIVIILAVLFGNGGWGGNGNQNTDAILSALNGNTGRDMIMQAVNGNQTAISQLASTLNFYLNALQGTLNTIGQ